MTTKTLLAEDTGRNVKIDGLAVARATMFLLLLLILALPTQLHAQDYAYTTDNGTITITKYIGSGGAVIIPGTINGLPVTHIGDDAFFNCSSLAQVTLPDSVTHIGYSAFDGCSSLTQVTLPNSVTSIGQMAFAWCSSLAHVTLPDSVTQIGGYAFGGCSGLAVIQVDGRNNYYASLDGVLFDKSLNTLLQYPGGKASSYTAPDSVTHIGEYAFCNCSSLTQITIPNSVTFIGDSAFSGCSSLAQIAIPNSVTYIGNDAFSGCSSLAQAILPNSITSIGYWAFSGCSSLTQVTIPDSVTRIDYWAFRSCSSLTNVTVGSGVTSVGDWAFAHCTNLAGVYFQGDAPILYGGDIFYDDHKVTVYYLPGTTGWGATFWGRPAVLLVPPISLRIVGFGILNGRFGFTVAGPSNIAAVVEAGTNLAAPVWSPVGTNTLTGGSSYFSDPEWANHPTRFYRLRSP